MDDNQGVARFNRILIANRGEIACRIIRTAKVMGYRTVAVYSDVDVGAPHTKMADQAVLIGAAPANESYLDMEKIIAAAQRSGAQAVHPGYGFLSENPEFAKRCEQAGLVFIGPSAHAIEVMGNKAEAKRRMLAAGVPCVPGYEGEDQSVEVLVREAGKIGFPIMVKAAAGGGGRGMRLVAKAEELEDVIKIARSESQSAFGSDELILEKAIVCPRHVEIQVMADQYGNAIHFGERDCSVQRRHQKVIEEAPCPTMTVSLREAMGDTALAVVNSLDYVGAGTVEFLLDADQVFYFLEMNTRLQVEHPVTELVTSVDLVAMQLAVAQGEKLSLAQEDVQMNGHAIEVRLYAEDPSKDFLPAAGTIEAWWEASGDGVRVDAGIESGQVVSPFYDPMIAKVIAYGDSREMARKRLLNALQASTLFGVAHNKFFLQQCLQTPSFVAGQATTAFIAEEFANVDLVKRHPSFVQIAIAAALDIEAAYRFNCELSLGAVRNLKNWSSASPLLVYRHYCIDQDDDVNRLDVECQPDRYRIACPPDDRKIDVKVLCFDNAHAVLLVDEIRHNVDYIWNSLGDLQVAFDDCQAHFYDALFTGIDKEGVSSDGRVIAPMHGQVLDVMVKVGDAVGKGDILLVLEAMKMQHQILAEADSIIKQIQVGAGDQVAIGDLLIVCEG